MCLRKTIFLLVFGSIFLSCSENEDVLDTNLAICPNPFSNHVNVQVFVPAESSIKIVIYSNQFPIEQMSPEVKTINENPVVDEKISGSKDYRFDLSKWEKGSYIMDVITNGKVERYNLIRI